MKPSKRHAPPSVSQLLSRVYRRQIAQERRFDAIQALLEQEANGRTVLLKTVTDHCWRLLREKETLMRLVDHEQLRAANRYLSRPLDGRV